MVALSVSLLGLLLAGGCAPAAPPPLGPSSIRVQPEREAPAGAASASAQSLFAVPARELVITSGFIELEAGPLPRKNSSMADEFRVSAPVLRAWVGQQPRSSVELEFTYLGPSAREVPLASGEGRRQIGVELRAQDSCNVVYVMWRIEPVQELVVSLKRNPGQHQHSECGDRGYITLEPAAFAPLPALHPGEPHVLRATLSGSQLDVQVDGKNCWQGLLPPAGASLDGPVGLRSDNGQFDVRVRAGSPAR